MKDIKTVDNEEPQMNQDISSTQSTENNSHKYPIPAFKDNIEVDTKGRGDESHPGRR